MKPETPVVLEDSHELFGLSAFFIGLGILIHRLFFLVAFIFALVASIKPLLQHVAGLIAHRRGLRPLGSRRDGLLNAAIRP